MNSKIIISRVLFLQVLFTCHAVRCQVSDSLHVRSDSAIEKNLSTNRTAIHALDQASIGGAAGLLIGKQMDGQVEELKKVAKGAMIERISEGILITLQLQSLFEDDSFEPLPATRTRFRNLARILNNFQHSCMLIEVHTDCTGEEVYNQALSDKRAKSLETLLTREGVHSRRLLAKGYGDKQPLFLNMLSAERSLNRRIELIILANDEMKALARKGELGEFFATRK